MRQLIECVPNFSEGRNPEIIKQITDVVETVEGVKLLDVDPGASTNRTVVTFVGVFSPSGDSTTLYSTDVLFMTDISTLLVVLSFL